LREWRKLHIHTGKILLQSIFLIVVQRENFRPNYITKQQPAFTGCLLQRLAGRLSKLRISLQYVNE